MSSPLLTTKINIPPANSKHISRPRLFEQSGRSNYAGLILVSAPAGFGKSSAVNAWIRANDSAVAWFSIDEDDNDPTRFWTYLLAALQSGGTIPGVGIPPLIKAGSEAVATALINELNSNDEPITLILDDYHLISEIDIHRGVSLLVEHLPAQLKLVIITRADPPFPLARLRAYGKMTEIRASDLRFTFEETTVFLKSMLNHLPDENDTQALHTRTEGWIVGLQLAALALQNYEDSSAFIEAFAGSHHYVVEYLMEEVVSQQPEHIQEFLLETSIVKELHLSLCNAVTGRDDSEQILNYLVEKNLFLLALNSEHTRFRYHHLFSDLLRHRLDQTLEASSVRELYRRASIWYAEADLFHEAIEYALAGLIYEDAARLLETNWYHAFHQGELETLRRWINKIPDETVKCSAPLNMAYCWLYLMTDEFYLIEPHLLKVHEVWEALEAEEAIPQQPAYLIIPSLAETMAAVVAIVKHNPADALLHAQRALELVPEQGVTKTELLEGAATYWLAYAHYALGQFEQAAVVMRSALEYLKRGQNATGFVAGVHTLTQIYLELGQPEAAEEVCVDALDYLAELDLEQTLIAGLIYVSIATIALKKGNEDAVEQHINRAVALAEPVNYAPVLSKVQQLREEIDLQVTQLLIEPLTERELEVLRYLCEGYSNQKIAEELVVAISTVKKHVGNIYGKLEVNSRTQAILRAQELGFVEKGMPE